jgi:hypothetical protein
MQTRTSSPLLVTRPFRHLCDLWLVAALFVAVKAAPAGGVDKQMTWGFTAFAALLVGVWVVGRLNVVQRIFEILLGNDSRIGFEVVHSHTIGEQTALSLRPNQWSRSSSWRWLVAGFCFVAGLLAMLEWRQPYYFVQDDNLSQFLPVVLQGCRSLFHDGVFPTWNPHQFLGSPTTSLGTYALTYPPTYLSYAVAEGVLGNEYATLDVFCILHLLVGYFATFWACRVMGIRPSLAATAAVCFALAGFFLIAGKSWYYMTPVAAWTPLLIGLLERYRLGNVGGKWVLATGGVLGVLFHSGNAQMWSYAMLFYFAAVAILLVCRTVDWSQIFPAVAALLVGLAIAAPLLVAQFAELSGLPRRAGDGSMLQFLPSMFLPYPVVVARFPGVDETPDFEQMGHMNYAGTVFSVAAALGMLSLIAYRWNRRTAAANVWLLLAWMALLFTFGRSGGLWYVLAKFPPFSSFKHPFKFMAFATLFMVVGGTLLIERGLRHWKIRRRWELGLCAVVAMLVGYHVWMSTPSFCDYGFEPYPELPAEMQKLAATEQPQRIYAIGPRRSLSPEYALSMMHQLPTVWGLYALDGYDPLVSASPRYGGIADRLLEPAEASGLHMELGFDAINLYDDKDDDKVRKAEDALKRADVDDHGFWGRSFRVNLPKSMRTLRAYGVRWAVIYGGPQSPSIAEGSKNEYFWKTDPVVEQLAEEVREQGTLVVDRPEVDVYELSGATPMAFAVDSPRKALPVKLDAGGLEVDTSSLPQGGQVVVNVVPTKFLRGDADGRALEIGTDKWGRLLFNAPPGTRTLSAGYRPPWLAGCGVGLVVAATAIGLMRYRRRLQEFVERWLPSKREQVEAMLVKFRKAA